jgi:hypothetical protein
VAALRRSWTRPASREDTRLRPRRHPTLRPRLREKGCHRNCTGGVRQHAHFGETVRPRLQRPREGQASGTDNRTARRRPPRDAPAPAARPRTAGRAAQSTAVACGRSSAVERSSETRGAAGSTPAGRAARWPWCQRSALGVVIPAGPVRVRPATLPSPRGVQGQHAPVVRPRRRFDSCRGLCRSRGDARERVVSAIATQLALGHAPDRITLPWSKWRRRRVLNPEAAGSTPAGSARRGDVAQRPERSLVERDVAGSTPVVPVIHPTNARSSEAERRPVTPEVLVRPQPSVLSVRGPDRFRFSTLNRQVAGSTPARGARASR